MAATLHASKGYPGAALEAPALSMRARYGLGLSPLSLSTITTLSGSHVIAEKKITVENNGKSPDNGKTRLNPTYAHTQGVSGAAGSRVLFFSILSVALY